MATADDDPNIPIWARDDAFPDAPPGWGWMDAKETSHPCDSQEKLAAAIRDDRDGSVTLVWTPDHAKMRLPEELPAMGDALRAVRERWNQDDLEEGKYKMRWFGMICAGFTAYSFFQGFVYFGKLAAQSGKAIDVARQLKFAAEATLSSTQSGIALLMFMIFAFIPWYQARKRRKALNKWSEEGIASSVPALRFETWLERQKAPVTRILLVLMAFVGLAQLLHNIKLSGWSGMLHNWGGVPEAGLVKESYRQGEWWRLFTGPLLHGNIVHFLMNASGLAYLGKRLEVFARWPHLPMVFLFSACVGGIASAHFVTAPSVGASGGLMGWLGFLLVFETLHKGLVPIRARRRLLAGVFLTALIGLIGYHYIDNAAHAGGLLAGMIYAGIVFPKSATANRPSATIADQITGAACLFVLIASGALAISRILGA